MLAWWGLFATPSLTLKAGGDYHYAYLEAVGPYSKLANKLDEVRFELKQQGIQPGAEITLMMSDPRSTPHDALKARTGYLLPRGAQVKPPLLVADIPAHPVLAAEIKAHPLLAYGKNYGALIHYTKEHQLPFSLPTIEILDHSVLRVEMPIDHPSNGNLTSHDNPMEATQP